MNTAAFNIHSRIHMLRPDVHAAVHTHSTHGRAFSTLGKELSPITQDSCAFYQDHVLYDDFGGVVTEADEGLRIATALGSNKAAILQNHGLLTVGASVDAAVWWYIAMDRCCEVELLALAAAAGGGGGSAPSSGLKQISPQVATGTSQLVGAPFAGWFQFQPLYARIVKEEPDFLL